MGRNIKETLPQVVIDGYEKFFELGLEAQNKALPLIEEAVIERGRNFPEGRFYSYSEREAAERRWKEYLASLGDRLANGMDDFYWSGHGGNMDGVTILRNTFLKIFQNQDAETLLQTKERIEKILGR